MAAALAGCIAGSTAAWAVDGPFLTTVGPSKAPPGSERLCRAVSGVCATRTVGRHLAGDAERSLASEVNGAVNRRMTPFIDPAGIGTSWVPPAGQVGDCKHYAVTKKSQLVAAGVDPRRLLLAIVARPDNVLHAVLVYRSDTGDLILDSQSDRIMGWRESAYTVIKMQNPANPARWSLVLEGPRARRG
jgi:predicted transglutaminase-like cysteine proteinase